MDAILRSAGAHAVAVALLLVAVLGVPGTGWAHAFLDRSEPRVGHTLAVSPPVVRVWFDSSIEPAFSAIRVEDSNRQQVDKGDGRVSPTDRTLLEVNLPPLPPGRYEVHWSVVGKDGHRTVGSFSFRVK